MSKTTRMRFVIPLGIVALLVVGCSQKQDDRAAIQSAIRQHLTSLGTLNLQAMDMDFNNISVQNNLASAQVSFHPKTGAPAGATMQVSYQLEKQEGTWKVIKKSVPGGMIEHPDPGANPHGQAANNPVHGNLPNFQEILGTGNSSATDDSQNRNSPQPSPKK